MKPFVSEKFPLIQNGIFNQNSDFDYLIRVIDKLKKKYTKKKKKQEKNNKNEANINDNNKKSQIDKKDNKEVNINKANKEIIKVDEKQHKSIGAFKNDKRRGTETNIPDLEEIQNYTKMQSENITNKVKDMKERENAEDIKKLRKKNISKIYTFLQQFMEYNNIKEIKRTNSMINLRPHSHTITSETTNDSSIIEDNNLNINKIIENNNKNDLESNININNETKNNDKKSKNIYGDLFTETEEKKNEKEMKVKTMLRSKSIALLREMAPFYKDDIPIEGKTIIFKPESNNISYIFPDILLQKIIKDDFIQDNILLIYHFCQQCFCFVNKEIFFRKLFSCYKFFKKNNTPKEYLYNLVEFINILVIEMFQYYQKIDLKEIHIINIKKFYNQLITEIINEFSHPEIENQFNKIDNNTPRFFRFESIDFYNNIEDTNINNKNNCDYTLDKKTLINMNLNFEIKNINILSYKEKLPEKEKEEKEGKEVNKEYLSPITSPKSLKITKTLSPKLQKSSKFIKTKKITKEFKEEEKDKLKENKDKKNKVVSFKDENPGSIEEKEKEKEEDLNLIIEEDSKEKKLEGENEENKLKEEKEKKEKLFQISRTLRNSQIINNKNINKIFKEMIIEEEENQKEKSDDEDENPNDNSIYSDKSDDDSDSKSESNNSEEEKEKEEKNVKKHILSKSCIFKSNLKKKEDNKESLEIIKNLLESNNIPENLLSINEKLLDKLQYIIILLDKDNNGDPSNQEIKEAKESLNFYKTLHSIKNKTKKNYILPIQRNKRLTKSYSFFGMGTQSIKMKEDYKKYLSKGYFCVTEWPLEAIGDHLIKLSKSLLNKIHPREIYRGVFLKKDKEKASPNVVECIKKFNRFTSFIIEDILSYDFAKERAKVYEKWVLIAEYCQINKDYNDLIAIYSALNHYIITGLKNTMKEVRYKISSTFKRINDFCTCEGNYKKIREDMNNCDKTGEIFIPYLGMLLRDINFYEENGKYIDENGCINIEKIENIAKIFERNFKFQNVPDKKEYIKELSFLEHLEDKTEEELENMANQLEPEFKIKDLPKSGKRPTNIDLKYLWKYAKFSKRQSVMNFGRENFMSGRKTISIMK